MVEEASIKCSLHGDSWEPTIQLLEYEDGTQQLRFCVYAGWRFKRIPLVLGTREIRALAKQVKQKKRVSSLLSKLTA